MSLSSRYRRIGLKRKFLVSTIAAVVVVTLLGASALIVFASHDPARIPHYVLLVSLFYILVGITGILLVSRIMVQPVLSLTKKVEEVRRGHLNIDIDVDEQPLADTGDEMNQLVDGFHQMVADLRTNIDALRRAKEEAEIYSHKLSQSHERLQAIFDGLPDGVMIVDRNYRIVHVNPVIEKLMGRSLDEVRGQHCYAMCQGVDERCSFCRADTVFQLGGRASTFCTKPAFGGSEDRILEIYDFPIENERGEIHQVIEYVKDVTEAVKMQQSLKGTQRLAEVGNMAAVVAHEVRNPLNAIRGAAHYLQGECDESLRSYVQLIEEQVERVSKVTADLLDFSKPLVVAFQRGAIEPVVEQALAQVENVLKDRGIRVEKDVQKGLPMFPRDPGQVERALVNLLTNAAEATGSGGCLRVSAYRRNLGNGEPAEEIEVTVEDDGPGLDGKDTEELFKPFFTMKLNGTGLGLAIVRKIMDRHQGGVRLEPCGRRGTKAILRFPAKLKVYETKRQHFGYR